MAAARELGWAPMVVEPNEALAVGVAKRLRPVASEPGLGESEARLRPHQAQIRAWLEAEDGGRGLRLSKVKQLIARQGVDVPYSSLHRFATKHCGFADARRITVRVADVAPGEVAEVDFGRLGLVPDPETGKRRVLHALIVTLVYSRHQYVHVTHSQTVSDLVEGLEDRRASTIVTSNRAIDEWIPLFDDPIVAQSALDRLAHNAYPVVMEGESYRKRQRPGERERSPRGSREARGGLRETRTLGLESRPGPGRWDQGRENTGIILVGSDISST